MQGACPVCLVSSSDGRARVSDGRYLYEMNISYPSTRLMLFLLKNNFSVYVRGSEDTGGRLRVVFCFDEPFPGCFSVLFRRTRAFHYEQAGEDVETLKPVIKKLFDLLVEEMPWCMHASRICEDELVRGGIDVVGSFIGKPELVYSVLGVSR